MPAITKVTGSGAPIFALAAATMPSAAHITTAPMATGSTISTFSRPPGFMPGTLTAVRVCAFVTARAPELPALSDLRRVISALEGRDSGLPLDKGDPPMARHHGRIGTPSRAL